jgi:hypothetical protein
MVVRACNPSTREAEAGELRVQGQPGLYSETLSQNTNKQTKVYWMKYLKSGFFILLQLLA